MSTIIIGSGIIGLTTAIAILDSDPTHRVHIIASRLPGDPSHPEYASACAGAHHLSFAADDDKRQARWDRLTFEVMQEELDEEGESTGLMSLRQTEYFDGDEKHLQFLEGYPEFRVHPESDLPPFSTHSVSFRSLTMTPSTYLSRLVTRFETLGGKIHQGQLDSLSRGSIFDLCTTLGLDSNGIKNVVLCIGLGALSLKGLEDSTVFPTRGQVVVVRAPWVKTGWTRQIGSLSGGEGGKRTYVIPRGNGEVVLGGTREVGDWNPHPDPETTIDILQRVLEIYPSFLSGHPTSPLSASTPIEQRLALLETLVENVIIGYRPSREAGPRVERGQDLQDDEADGGGEGASAIKVFYNYGHGGAGWQACWGAAEETRDLVLTAEAL